MDWRKRLFGNVSSEEEVVEVEETEPIRLESDILWHKGETVSDMIVQITKSKSVAFEEVADNISRAVSEDKILLVDPSPPKNILAYLISYYSVWFWAVVAFVGLLYASIYLVSQSYPFIFMRYIVGAVFILFIPGYVLIESLYPKAKELDKLERFALDVGLSIAVVPLVGLVLNYTPWGIRLEPILISLSITVILLGIVGVWRKYSLFKLMFLRMKNY